MRCRPSRKVAYGVETQENDTALRVSPRTGRYRMDPPRFAWLVWLRWSSIQQYLPRWKS